MPGPDPAVAATRSAVRACVADLAAAKVDGGPLVLVACSGGADSLALAAAAAFESARSRREPRGSSGSGAWRAGAVVVDHGLQPGSDAVAAGAADACRRLGLAPVLVVRADVTRAGGPEAAARDARYAVLARAADELGAEAVLLGHTLDDQAETVLLALARGSGVRAVAGMATVRGRWRRPLLGLRRADTEQACAAQGLEPWHDPTNGRPDAGRGADGLPLRSRVRARVLPVLDQVLGPGVPGALARTAELAAEAADVVDALAADLLAAADVPVDDGVALDVDALVAALPGVRRRALALAAVRAGAPAGSVRRQHVLALDALVVAWTGQGPVDLPGARSASRACGRLVLGAARTAGTTSDGSARGPG